MKNLLLSVLILLSSYSFSQTTLMNLSTESSPAGDHYIAVGKAGWSAYKKMTLTKLNSLEKAERVAVNSSIKNATGIDASFNYVPFTNAKFIIAKDFSDLSLDANLKNADWLLDSVLYSIKSGVLLFDTGATSSGTIRKNLNNTAAGSNGFAINSYNNAVGINSFARGINSVTQRHFSSANSSGYFAKPGDAQGSDYIMYALTRENGKAELKINNTYLPTLTTDQLSKFTIDVVAVSDSGKAGTLGMAFSQLVQITAINNAGNSALVGTADTSNAKRTAGWMPTLAVTVDNDTESVVITVTGVVGYRIRWVAYIRETSVGFRDFNLGY